MRLLRAKKSEEEFWQLDYFWENDIKSSNSLPIPTLEYNQIHVKTPKINFCSVYSKLKPINENFMAKYNILSETLTVPINWRKKCISGRFQAKWSPEIGNLG